jgi:transcription antitermination factor NusG
MWFAVQTRPRYERVVSVLLEQKGYQQFLPTYRVERRWSDRVKEIDLPLFPGYLFCQGELVCGPRIIDTPGVVRIVGAKREPTPVPETEILDIRRIVASGLPLFPCAYLEPGMKVRIQSGVLSGLEGTMVDVRKRRRVVVSVALLQRSVAIEIAQDFLAPVSAQRATT